jgi:hypothetical protein
MACSGCARRRAKIAAAYHAVKAGFSAAKQSYSKQDPPLNLPRREGLNGLNVIDIREKQA